MDKLGLPLVAIVAILIGGVVSGDQTAKKPRMVVKIQDIGRDVRILGRCGEPLGDLITVRGEWVQPGIGAKDRSLILHVTEVNGKQLDEDIEFHSRHVQSIRSHNRGYQPDGAQRWEWRHKWQGEAPCPKPAPGEKWEILGVETGYLEPFSHEVEREIEESERLSARPVWATDVYTKLNVIAIKRIE